MENKLESENLNSLAPLRELWTFPSDHLPVGALVEVGGRKLEVATLNCLADRHLHWVTEKDSQGLKGSLITTAKDRNDLVAEVVVEMLTQKEHPKDLIALQEVSNVLVSKLRESLPDDFHIWKKGELAFIHNRNILTVTNISYHNIFQHYPGKFVMKIKFSISDSNSQFWVVVVHMPGDPKTSLSSRRNLANYLERVASTGLTAIAMGDMNFTAKEMVEVFSEVEIKFDLVSPYPTNINPAPERFSKAIDHIVVLNSAGEVTAREPDEVWERLEKLVELLKNRGISNF